jgi:ADP-heptose:LPS heptosyltransferase
MRLVAEPAGVSSEPAGDARRTDSAVALPMPAASAAQCNQQAIVILQRDERLGDAITHLPAYYALRHAYPRHRIVGLFARETVLQTSLARVGPMFFDEIHVGLPLDVESRILARRLDQIGNVDVVLDFRANRRAVYGFVGARGRARHFLGNVSGYALRFGVPGLAERRPAQNIRRYHRMVEIVAGRELPYDYRLPPCAAAEEQAAALLPAGRRYVGLAMSAPGSGKEWPLERFVAVATGIAKLGLCPVFLLGPRESSMRERIRAAMAEALVIDLAAAGNDAGYLPWLFLAAADRLTAIVAVESGIGHLVATRDIPVLTLAGPTNVRRWRPVTPFWWLVRAQDFGSSKMEAIPLEAVRHALADMLRFAEARVQRSEFFTSLSPGRPAPAAPMRAMS